MMDSFRVPLNPTWFSSSNAVCTPDDGFLYVGGFSTIVYISPLVKNQRSDVVTMQCVKTTLSLDSDLDWSTTKYFAVLDDQFSVNVWDLNRKLVVLSHKAHRYPGEFETRSAGRNQSRKVERDSEIMGTLCFIQSRHLISNRENGFIKLCLASGTYTSFALSPVFVKDNISVMVGSPYNEDIMAVGTKRGLVMIVDINKKNIVYKLRGHDHGITSLAWMIVHPSTLTSQQSLSTPNRPKLQAKTVERLRRGPPQPIVDSNDVFDIYDYDDCAEEFGASARPATTINVKVPALGKEPDTTEIFDYVEACKNLKQDILQSVSTEEGNENQNDSFIDNDGADLSATLSQTEHVDEELSNSKKACDECSSDESYVNIVENALELTTFADADLMEVSMTTGTPTKLPWRHNHSEPITYLASGSREAYIWIWNTVTGVGEHKIELPRPPKLSQLPSPFTMLCWVNEKTLLANTPNGDVVWCEISISSEFKIISKLKTDLFTDRAVSGLFKCTPRLNGDLPYIWSKSILQKLICTRITETPQVLASYSTLSMGMQAIAECPHDYSKIAMAGTNRRIHILSLSTLTPNNIQISAFVNRVQSKVLYLAWHPHNENLLAYSTDEGRVAIYDVSKSSNMPVIMKPFTGKSVYQLSWAQIGNETDDSKRMVLFACSNNRLVYFPESGDSKHCAVDFKEEVSITAVSAGKDYLALGSADGECIIQPLKNLKRVIWSKKLHTKYVSECAWSTVRPTKLAVSCSEAGIHVFDFVSDTEVTNVGELVGQKGVPYVKWSNESEYKLVSAGFDGTVRTWDVATLTCTSLYQYDCMMYSAIFMPSDENFIMCSGRYETLHVFDSRLHMHTSKSIKDKLKIFADDMRTASLIQTETSKLAAAERKKNKKTMAKRISKDDGEVNALSEALQDIELQEEDDEQQECSDEDVEEAVDIGRDQAQSGHNRRTKNSLTRRKKSANKEKLTHTLRELSGSRATTTALRHSSSNLNFAPICLLSTAEFNATPLKHLRCLADNPLDSSTLNTYLFSTRERCLELLNLELNEHHKQRTNSVANVLVPQLGGDLKIHIERLIHEKTLTREALALAPSVSYPFWKQCCDAFAKQVIEKGCPLQAIPFLLVCQKEDTAINVLCESHYFREAYIVAKLNKEIEDPVLNNILSKWKNFLGSIGNYEALALLEMALNRPDAAAKALSERQNLTEEAKEIIDLLSKKSV